MATTIILLQVAMFFMHSNSALASTLNQLPRSDSKHEVPTIDFTPTQFHIQTDDGKNRFFNYQTWSGQFRKETRQDDGSVVGSYGWVDANGMLRVYEYVADKAGYRITKNAMYSVGQQTEAQSSTKSKLNVGKINRHFKRRKTHFLRPRVKEQKETELSNDIFGEDENLHTFPLSNVSPRPEVISLRPRTNRQQVVHKARISPLLPFIRRRPTPRLRDEKQRDFLDLEREQNNVVGDVGSNRLQRRISTPDGQIKVVNVQPLFDDEITPSEDPAKLERSQIHNVIDNGDDILFLPSHNQPSGRVVLNTPHRRRKLVDILKLRRQKQEQERNRFRFSETRNREQRKLRQNPTAVPNSGPFVIKSRRKPFFRRGRIPMTRQRNFDSQSTNEIGEIGTVSVNYVTSKAFHHENTFEDGQRKGQYGYIDPIGVRRVVTYTTGSRAPSRKPELDGIRKIKENDFYGTNTYFKAS